MGFRGEFEVTMDGKNRFLLPAAVKKQVPEENTSAFVVTRGFDNCLFLYPKKTWDSIVSNFSKLSDLDDKVRVFRRFFINGATDVDMDNAGRLLIQKSFAEYASLGKDLVLTGSDKKIEIWDKSKYTQFFEGISQEQFKDAAQDVKQKMDGLQLDDFFI